MDSGDATCEAYLEALAPALSGDVLEALGGASVPEDAAAQACVKQMYARFARTSARALDAQAARHSVAQELVRAAGAQQRQAEMLVAELHPPLLVAAEARADQKQRQAKHEEESKKRKLKKKDDEKKKGAKKDDKLRFVFEDEKKFGKRKRAAGEEPPKKRRAEPDAKGAEVARREKQFNATLDGIWRDIARKDIPKAHKLYVIGSSVRTANCRKTATLAAKEARKWHTKTNKHVKDLQIKARRAMREMMSFWKRNEKEERDSRKKAEKEALDSARRQEEEREAMRQSRKLNFLITQTELYSHFVGSKEKDVGEGAASDVVAGEAAATAVATGASGATGQPSKPDFDTSDDAQLAAAAAENARSAVSRAREKASQFDDGPAAGLDSGPAADALITQPRLLSCQLKEYQLKGLTWLANLYEQGINGILADEMGLGKTVQSISVMAYLAEVHDIWGPFLVVAPASTLHNWQQEISKFVPEFKVLPYWGSNKDRKVLRKFWDRKQLRYVKSSPFHVLVTSYQLVVADAQYFNRIKWQYMILDEAQAIKSSQSSRWKSLLNLQCRNRLLLTGTPIQNSMQELWALLHFIMPTLFDSHEEFSDWFSKDIESHATKNKELNEAQLKRLHMILKPFMLRRVKKHVQQELGDKIEIDVYCDLTSRQKMLYKLVKSQISIRDLLERGTSGDDAASLMNLVMQFRKVCNHPDLFERQEVNSAFSMSEFGATTDWLREPSVLTVSSTARNAIEMRLPAHFATHGLLDVPGPESDAALRERTLKRLGVVFDPLNEYIQSVAKFVNTPAGALVREAQQGLFERALARGMSGSYALAMDTPTLISSPQGAFNEQVHSSSLYSVGDSYVMAHYLRELEPAYRSKATAPPVSLHIANREFYLRHMHRLACPFGLLPLSLNEEWARFQHKLPLTPGLLPEMGAKGFTTISVPSMAKFIADSGKLKKLDELLVQLKREGHRVLIYFQMTRMMDLMEDYLTYRQHKYLRLDGSSKLGDRRDLVNDWQTRPDLFVFLLSTRAGGLGINLTAADTVIFFDSDWNPTIDSQAMDRAHRLGQTKQVTVYRLLVRGTIEERMRNRAKQKEQVQAVVMEGTNAARKKQEDLNNDVAFWLLDDEEK